MFKHKSKDLFLCWLFSFVLVSTASAEIYRWTDNNGQTHYSDVPPESIYSRVSAKADDRIKPFVKLDVPVVKQGKMLCGPAEIQMLFQFWGIHDYDQYDIAYNILKLNPNSKRVVKSGVIKGNSIDWLRYPGTGTNTMRNFLKRFAVTENPRIKKLPKDPHQAKVIEREMFTTVKRFLSKGIPVIVHQYWEGKTSNGHYRIVTGYDEQKKIVYLNDPNPGRKKMQSYDTFLKRWNVDKPGLHYNAIVFNIHGHKFDVQLKKYQANDV